jgi:hypothetical protein
VTLRAKYTIFYVGGMVFWAGIFYYVCHHLLGWRLLPLAVAYLVLALILGRS